MNEHGEIALSSSPSIGRHQQSRCSRASTRLPPKPLQQIPARAAVVRRRRRTSVQQPPTQHLPTLLPSPPRPAGVDIEGEDHQHHLQQKGTPSTIRSSPRHHGRPEDHERRSTPNRSTQRPKDRQIPGQHKPNTPRRPSRRTPTQSQHQLPTSSPKTKPQTTPTGWERSRGNLFQPPPSPSPPQRRRHGTKT